MCSVCGIATTDPDDANVEAVVGMLRSMRHRGPDGCGVHLETRTVHAADPESLAEALASAAPPPARIVLGQSLLAITGTAEARQPLSSDDGRLALAHNGEVYNHEELRPFVNDPSKVATGSDSEILLRVLEHHHAATGRRLAEALRRALGVVTGMYAVAATDGTSVALARDPIGKKPLYYVGAPGVFAWASERKALEHVARAHDATIHGLRPGHQLHHAPGGPVTIRRVETIAPPPIDILEPETAVREYQTALTRSIRRRTRGLERAAVLFSGGVDSVLVARLLQRAGLAVKGYVAGVEGSSDVGAAIEAAAALGLPLDTSLVTEELLERELPTILRHIELHGPVMAETSVPMWFASGAARRDGHRVIFTGQAADELFGGYPWYNDVLSDHGPLTLHARMWEDLDALPLDTLEREDRVMMAWSLEARAPFLDPDVIHTAMRIAPSLKVKGAHDRCRKHPHRELALRLGVPHEIVYRPKAMAQDGADVHALLARIASRRIANPHPAPEVPDFGSNYRYRDGRGRYAEPAVYVYLDQLVRQHGLMVAAADGSARAPERRPANPVPSAVPTRGQPRP